MPRGRSGGSFANTGRMTGGQGGAFHYNFGIAIAAGAVRELGLFTNGALGLTAAIYALGRVSSEFVDSVKQNTLAFGGQLKAINAMVFAQKQLLAGNTEFGQQDIMSGMRQLMQVGINARKEFKFVSDAAEATGQSFTSMSGVINQAIQGNMQGMVQMGLLTERATRNFLRFPANTIQRQAAIMSFLKNNQALQRAIANNFQTVAGQWRRVLEFIKMFAQSIVGNPRDPSSLYSQVRKLITDIANWLNKHAAGIKKAGTAIGMVLGWVVKQVGNFIKFVGRQVDKVINIWDNHMGNFKQRMWSLMLWLELWKVHIVSFLKEHKDQIIGLLKAYLAFKGVLFLVSTLGKIAKAYDTITMAVNALTVANAKNALLDRYNVSRFGVDEAKRREVISKSWAASRRRADMLAKTPLNKRNLIFNRVLQDAPFITAPSVINRSKAIMAEQEAIRNSGLYRSQVGIKRSIELNKELKALQEAPLIRDISLQKQGLGPRAIKPVVSGLEKASKVAGKKGLLGSVGETALLIGGTGSKSILSGVGGFIKGVSKLLPMWGWIALAVGGLAVKFGVGNKLLNGTWKIVKGILDIVGQLTMAVIDLIAKIPGLKQAFQGFADVVSNTGNYLTTISRGMAVSMTGKNDNLFDKSTLEGAMEQRRFNNIAKMHLFTSDTNEGQNRKTYQDFISRALKSLSIKTNRNDFFNELIKQKGVDYKKLGATGSEIFTITQLLKRIGDMGFEGFLQWYGKTQNMGFFNKGAFIPGSTNIPEPTNLSPVLNDDGTITPETTPVEPPYSEHPILKHQKSTKRHFKEEGSGDVTVNAPIHIINAKGMSEDEIGKAVAYHVREQTRLQKLKEGSKASV